MLRWNRASTTTMVIAASLAVGALAAAFAFLDVRGLEEAKAWLGVASGVVLLAVLLTRAAMATTWRIGNGTVVRERTWLRAARSWDVRGGAEVSLTRVVTSGRNAHEKWGVALRSGGEEIALGEKSNGEAEARAVGEALARELRAPLRYAPDGVAIRAEDLDLPFVERVAKYPELRVEPRPRPGGVPIRDEVLGSERVFRWRALNLYTLAAVAGLAVFSIVYVASDLPAVLRFLVEHPEWAAGVVAVPVALLAGVGFRLSAGPQGVEYQVTLFGVPVRTRAIPASELEEVHVRKVVNTPVLQLASDREVVRCRVYRWRGDDVLEWLAGEVQQALGGSAGTSRLAV